MLVSQEGLFSVELVSYLGSFECIFLILVLLSEQSKADNLKSAV
jgi:hypothetical protein